MSLTEQCYPTRSLYAYCWQMDEVLAFTMGKRNSKTAGNLLLKLKGLEIDWHLRDKRESFSRELSYYQHLIGKQFTKATEGINTWSKVSIRSLNRRITCFSQKLTCRYAISKPAVSKL